MHWLSLPVRFSSLNDIESYSHVYNYSEFMQKLSLFLFDV